MERALCLWIEDMNKKCIPISGCAVRQKAKYLYERFRERHEPESSGGQFTASKGWLHRLKARYGLKSIKITGEAASADHEAAAAFPQEFKKLVAEKGYHPEQIFSCDETVFFWKRMPIRTYAHSSVRQAPGYRAWKERLTLVLCSNAAWHTVEPGVLYRAKNPRALRHKSKDALPVFWQHDRKAWMTSTTFMEWFRHCFVPEVKKYLQQVGLEFRLLLILDNAPCRPEAVSYENRRVEVVFLPANTTALLQPLDQGIIRFLKVSYTRLVFDRIRAALDADPDLDVTRRWKLFTIADAIEFIKVAVDELRPATVKACWKNLWTGGALGSHALPEIEGEIEKVVDAAKEIGGDLSELCAEEVEGHIRDYGEEPTDEELEDLVQTSTEEEAEEEASSNQAMWTVPRLRESGPAAQALQEKIAEYDPQVERSLKVNRTISEGIEPLRQLLHELQKKTKQAPLTMFFPRALAAQDPQPSTSSATPSCQ
ncbi:hypothetical protein M514_10264, partial [Trichuris suis]